MTGRFTMTHPSGSRRPVSDEHGTSLRDMLTSILADCGRSRRERGLPDVAVTLDVPAGQPLPAAAAPLRRLLESLVWRALEAAARPDAESDAPPLRELSVTSIDLGGVVEIEVADSGAALARDVCSWLAGDVDGMPQEAGLSLAAARTAADRLGGTLRAANCPEGGAAITLRVPRRQAQRLAA
jgi:C4-dicarboxylate-specific signal transduction histidine kinase